MNFVKKLKSFLKLLIVLSTYPYTYTVVSLLDKKNIYEKLFKNYFSSVAKSKSKSIFNLDSLIRYAFDSNFYFYPNYLKRKYLGSSMANPEESVLTARYYRSKGFPDKFFNSNFAYKYLQTYINKHKNENLHIHQVGASSGREINYFSKLSNSLRFEASDLTKDVADDIKSNYPNLNCSVVDLSKENDLIKIAKRCSLIVAFGGLQYLLPKDLEKFFKICSFENCELIISQPMDYSISPFSIEGSYPRGNLSWSHSYIKTASKFGYKFEAISKFDYDFNKAQMLSAYFYK